MRKIARLLLILGAIIAILYRLRRRVYAFVFRLSPVGNRVAVECGLRVPMSDGVTLAADHYAPALPGTYPTILIRSPYGRSERFGGFGLMLAFVARRFAERGYHVIVQDTRGRFESGGTFDPYLCEKADGQATLAWLRRQLWYNGVLGMWGPSYLGMVQWALAVHEPDVKALVPTVTGTNLHRILYPDDAFDLGLVISWLGVFQGFDRNIRQRPHQTMLMMAQLERTVKPAFDHLPLRECDSTALGEDVPFYRTWLEHTDPGDALWREALDDVRLEDVQAPAHLVGGWYDFFLRTMLEDYARLRAAGRAPYLTLGSWTHLDPRALVVAAQEGIDWYDARLKGDRSRLRDKPVRLFVMGANEWRDYDAYPPRSTAVRYYLGEPLSPDAPTDADRCDRYTYDPAEPTPAVGGTQFGLLGGQRDNRALVSRPDVLTYTGDVLHEDLEIIGAVRLELYVRSSCAYTDFFGRVCDVYPNGRSVNICDGLFRVQPGKGELQPDGTLRIEVDLWATAHRFLKGHRLQVLVSSGAHPRWSRNLGTGEPLATGTAMCAAHQSVYRDREHPSALVLPVISAR
ncbi:MAG: CocE/NonD family hydrolase [Anaerolineae bacterium]|nr:CocE/NonD family hydrolase [Anaerolineae bacterium]